MRMILALTCAAALLAIAAPVQARGGGHSSGHTSASHASTSGSHAVRGYTRKNGTYVAPSHATNPNHTKADNWSSKGNVNPYTGKAGTKDPSK